MEMTGFFQTRAGRAAILSVVIMSLFALSLVLTEQGGSTPSQSGAAGSELSVKSPIIIGTWGLA